MRGTAILSHRCVHRVQAVPGLGEIVRAKSPCMAFALPVGMLVGWPYGVAFAFHKHVPVHAGT